jgi:hypothetical protein
VPAYDSGSSPWADGEWAFEMLLAQERVFQEVEMVDDADVGLYLLLAIIP